MHIYCSDLHNQPCKTIAGIKQMFFSHFKAARGRCLLHISKEPFCSGLAYETTSYGMIKSYTSVFWKNKVNRVQAIGWGKFERLSWCSVIQIFSVAAQCLLHARKNH